MTPALDDKIELVRPHWARLKFCEVRKTWLLLVPERVLFPCPTTVEVLTRLEHPRTLGELVQDLAQSFEAPEDLIEADIAELLTGLVEQGYVRRLEG